MIKDTLVNTTLTVGEENRDLADLILGKVVEVQSRWSPGSLVAAILDASTTKQLVAITPSLVASYNRTAETLDTTVYDTAEVFSRIGAVPSESKSKEIFPAGFPDAALSVALLEEPEGDAVVLDPPFDVVFLPSRPKYTVLSLVNRIESLAFADGRGYVILVDQETETVSVHLFNNQATADAAFAALLTYGTNEAAFDGVSVAFTQIPPVVGGSETPSYGWE